MDDRTAKLVAHQAWLRRIARAMARTPAAADDLVQDTCMAALDKAPPEESMRAWLRGVMRRLAWQQVRGEARRARREDGFSRLEPAVQPPDPRLEYGQARERLAEALARLPEPFRRTVIKRFAEELSAAEIAREENVPAATVRWRQARALELLRAELEAEPSAAPARRRRVLWLPILGVGVGEKGAALVGRRLLDAKLLWVAIGTAALAWTLSRPSAPPLGDAESSLADRTAGPAGWPDRPRPVLAAAAAAPAGRMVPGWRAGAGDGYPGRARPGAWPIAVGALDDLVGWDAVERDMSRARGAAGAGGASSGDLPRWHGVLAAAPGAGGAGWEVVSCQALARSLALLEGEATGRSSPALRFRAAALRANRALAARLGCPGLVAAPGTNGAGGSGSNGSGSGGPGDGGAGPGARRPAGGQPACVDREGPGGEACTVCTDSRGETTTVCAPAECETETLGDGSVCTTCAEPDGRSISLCESPSDCSSEVESFGRVCTTCMTQGGPATDCQPAQCLLIDHCLECATPDGRTATDCTMDYETIPMVSYTSSSGDSFSLCSITWGASTGSSTACYYPGTESCVSEGGCIDCRYPDGSGSGLCVGGPLPDAMAGRPASLPPPGQCAPLPSADERVTCLSCTSADLSAVTVCSHPAADSCEFDYSHDDAICPRCRNRDDGSWTLFCDRPVE